jgi:hypothetical protein
MPDRYPPQSQLEAEADFNKSAKKLGKAVQQTEAELKEIAQIEAVGTEISGATELLADSYQVYSDYLEQQGIQSVLKTPDFLKFLKNNLNQNFLNSLNTILAQKLPPTVDYNDEKIKQIFKEYEVNLLSLQYNYSVFPALTKKSEEVKECLKQTNFENINFQEAERLGLKLVFIRKVESAQELIKQVLSGDIDMNVRNGTMARKIEQRFIRRWKKQNPFLSPPCTQTAGGDSLWYLGALQQKMIVSNFDFGEARIPAIPKFDQDEAIFIDNRKEQDYAAIIKPHPSELIKALFDEGANTANITRRMIDNALWVNGDPTPNTRQPTVKHKAILKKLNCDPEQIELRLIRQDEYARVVHSKQFSQKNFPIHLDNYYSYNGDEYDGLVGSKSDYNEISYVGYEYIDLDPSTSTPTVCLVLAPKQRKD